MHAKVDFMDENVMKAHRVMCKKWTLLIIALLQSRNPRRFNDMLSELSGISTKTLSERLKELETTSLVRRKVFPEVPPRVEYSLTDNGKELSKSLENFYSWAMKGV